MASHTTRSTLWPLLLCAAIAVYATTAGAADNARKSQPVLSQLAKPAADEIVLTVGGDAIWNHKMSPADDAQVQSLFEVFKSSDIAFLNFEQVLADHGYPQPKAIAKADPSMVSEFTRAGVNLVSIANNHMTDFGPSGIETTRRTLEANGIKFSGAGANVAQAVEPAVIEKKGLKVALLAFLVSPTYPSIATAATDNTPGVAPIHGAEIRQPDGKVVFAPWEVDLKRMEAAIAAARKVADVVMVSFHVHWGPLEEIDPTGKQLIAHTAIDAGADWVVGHGPHVVNGIEFYKGKPIVYSVGNFAFQFNQAEYDFFPDIKKTLPPMLSNQSNFAGVVARMILTHDGKVRRMELLPINLNPEGDPRLVAGAPADAVLGRVKTLSEPFGTTIRREGWYAVVDLPQQAASAAK
jgi:poly-gamma-glutamate synthesis protein (capsule biosynthesis protein)